MRGNSLCGFHLHELLVCVGSMAEMLHGTLCKGVDLD